MAKIVKAAALVAGGVALAFTGVGLAVGMGGLAMGFGFGVSASTLFLVSAGLSVAGSLLEKSPSIPNSQADRLHATIDPRAPRKEVFGRCAMACEVRWS